MLPLVEALSREWKAFLFLLGLCWFLMKQIQVLFPRAGLYISVVLVILVFGCIGGLYPVLYQK